MTSPLVSVLVPIYNVERYLRECLDSLERQTLSEIEIICINDGSTDSSRAIIQDYLDRDSRFKVIDKANSGYGASMNMGLDKCTGEYIGIVESDDFIDSDAFEKMYLAAKKYDAQVVKSDFYLYWSYPNEVNRRFGWVDEIIEGHINPQVERDVFYRKPSIWSAIYKRSFITDNDINFLETPGASYQDAGFNFKVWASSDNAVLINDAYLHYRQDNEASSVNSPGKVFCVCDEYAEMHRYLDSRWQDRTYLRSILARMKFDSYEWNYDRLSVDLKKEFLPRMREEIRLDEQLGYLDLRDFDSNKATARALLLKDYTLYAADHESSSQPSLLSRFLYLARHYGPVIAFRVVAAHL